MCIDRTDTQTPTSKHKVWANSKEGRDGWAVGRSPWKRESCCKGKAISWAEHPSLWFLRQKVVTAFCASLLENVREYSVVDWISINSFILFLCGILNTLSYFLLTGNLIVHLNSKFRNVLCSIIKGRFFFFSYIWVLEILLYRATGCVKYSQDRASQIQCSALRGGSCSLGRWLGQTRFLHRAIYIQEFLPTADTFGSTVPVSRGWT